MNPFALVTPYPYLGVPDPTLQAELTKAMTLKANTDRLGDDPHVPFSMIALAADGKHRYAGVFDAEMDFSSSLLRVGVLYAAFELRAAVNRLAVANTIASQADLDAALPKAFNPVINATALSRMRDQPMGTGPAYATMFEFTGDAAPNGPVAFTSDFATAIHDMTVSSDDVAAGVCIRALGYAYLNAVLMKGGFFLPGKMAGDERGIWIGGDYNAAAKQRIQAINDGTGAFVMTTRAMCRLMALQETGELVDDAAAGGTSNAEMGAILTETARSGNAPFITTVSAAVRAAQPFELKKNKLGFAHLGRHEEGAAVASECSVLTWKTDAASDPDGSIAKALAKHKLTGTLVICWQNVHDVEIHRNYDGLSDVVTQTYRGLLAS